MGKMRRFLGIFISLFILFFVGNLLAASYSCPTYKQYVECNSGYYMTTNGSSTECNNTPVAGNTCRPCSVMGEDYLCEGGTACPVKSVTCEAGKYLPKNSETCETCPANSYCAGGTYKSNQSTDQGITGKCPAGFPSSEEGASTKEECYYLIEAGDYPFWSGGENSAPAPGKGMCNINHYCPSKKNYLGDMSPSEMECPQEFPKSGRGTKDISQCYYEVPEGKEYSDRGDGLQEYDCMDGFYCPGGTILYGYDEESRKTGATACPAPYAHSGTGATSVDACYLTLAPDVGVYVDQEAGATKTCPEGSYCPGGKIMYGETGKETCPKGFPNSEEGAGTKEKCYYLIEAGDYPFWSSGPETAPAAGKGMCNPGYYCPSKINYYPDESPSETKCPDEFINSSRGSGDISQCYKELGPGMEYSQGPDGLKVRECSARFYCPGGNIYYDSGATGATACPEPYTYSDTGSTSVEECYAVLPPNAGKYVNLETNLADTCPEGSYCPGGKIMYGETGKKECPRFYPSSEAGSSKQTDCYTTAPAGTYIDTSSGSVRFQPCAKGSYCPGGEVYYGDDTYGALKCPEAYPNSDKSSDNLTDCYITVPEGEYAINTPESGVGTVFFERCLENNYCEGGRIYFQDGKNGLTPCPKTYPTSEAGATTEDQCYGFFAPGKYVNEEDGSVEDCPLGYYCPGGKIYSNEDLKRACASGWGDGVGISSSEDCRKNVPAGSYFNGVLRLCPLGTYSEAHYVTNSPSSPSSGCTSCQGQNQYADEEGSASCKTVDEKYYATGCTGGNKCTGQELCPAGSYCANGIKTACPSTYPNSDAGATTQEECYYNGEPGSAYFNTGSSLVSFKCPAGSYCPGGKLYYGDDGERDCPAEYPASAESSSAIESCFASVPAGSYMTSSGIQLCEGGTYKEAHTVSYNQTSTCTTCPDDFTDGEAGTTNRNDCRKNVPAGSYMGIGMEIKQCAAGTYNEAHYVTLSLPASGCTDCSGRNQYSEAGAAACSTVTEGYFSTGCNEDGNKCTGQEQCAAGSYCASGISTSCPAGYPSSAAQSTSIESCYRSVDAGNFVANTEGEVQACAKGSYKEAHEVNYNSTSSCDSCPEGYRDGDGAVSQNECIGNFTKTGSILEPETPVGCGSIETDTCEPGTCSYQKKYDGSIAKDCTPSDCTKNITGVTAEENHYSDALMCPACEAGYSSSVGATSANQCTKSCTVECTQPKCPENSETCEFGSETETGSMNQVDKTCDAVAPVCSMTFTCKQGYEKTEDSCVPETYEITLNKNGGSGDINGSTGEEDAKQSCQYGVICDLPSEGLTRYGFTFTGWGDSAGCTGGTFQMTFTESKTIYACWSQQTTQCQAGKYYNGTDHVECPSGKYCPGTGFANVGQEGCSSTCPMGFDGSDLGATEATACYTTCEAKVITGGTTTAVNPKSYYNGSSYPACTYNATCNAGYEVQSNGTAQANCSKCGAGYSCVGGTTAKVECPAGSFCPDGIAQACPVDGTSAAGASANTECFKTCPPTLDIDNGRGVTTGNQYYNGSNYPACTFTAECDENYVPKDSPSESPSCVWGDSGNCPAGFYCPEGAEEPVACPDGGTTDGGAKEVTQCYKNIDSYPEFENGVANAKCNYSGSDYTNCVITSVVSCKAGYWYDEANEFGCSDVSNGFYSPESSTEQTECPAGYAGSNANAASFTDCYKTCELSVSNSVSVTPQDETVYGISEDEYQECLFTVVCEEGYEASNNGTSNPLCLGKGYTVYLNKNGGIGDVPESIQCEFGSAGCQLPDTSALSKTGYVPVAKWCATANGEEPCYEADQLIPEGVSEDGSDVTLYAVWEPGVYKVNLDDQSATTAASPSAVYLKYETGWFSDATAQKPITKLTTLPKKLGFDLVGYYSDVDSGFLVIDSGGTFKTSVEVLSMATENGTNIYAKWAESLTVCEAGTYYEGTGKSCSACLANNYCPGGSFSTDSGEIEGLNSCTDLGDGSWATSESGSKNESGCYKTCAPYEVVNGTAIPVSEKVGYPKNCEYKGISDSGNPCQIIDGVCVENMCKNDFEMINDECVPCNREHALSYKSEGNCVVATCEIGYHPNGKSCEDDIKVCSAPNAVYAEQKWNASKKAFDECKVVDCEPGYHVASNACVTDVQSCNVEHGTGFKEWDYAKNTWGECVATYCEPGYTNDPSETNDQISQCGECKNKYSVLGEIAASSYVEGCEIASCMYQGELYNLENNECMPICPQEEYEDETGTMVWDKSRKECVRTCKEGYTMW